MTYDKTSNDKSFILGYVQLFILENDERNIIYIKNNTANKLFYLLFSVKDKERERFIWDFDDRDPDYVITNYFLEEKYIKFDKEFLKKYFLYKNIVVNNTPINTVFKKK